MNLSRRHAADIFASQKVMNRRHQKRQRIGGIIAFSHLVIDNKALSEETNQRPGCALDCLNVEPKVPRHCHEVTTAPEFMILSMLSE